MLLSNIWEWIEQTIFPLPSVGGEKPLFNLYRDCDPTLEQPDGEVTRCANLRNYLASFEGLPRILIVGEAPGWRGCRFSGAPFCSEAQLVAGRLPFAGQPTSRAKKPYSEASATHFWQALSQYHPHFLAWNCVPLHPYQPGRPLSNRAPSRAEILHWLPLLLEFIAILQPQHVIAVGRSAQTALQAGGVPALAARHPAHGGAKVFYQQISEAHHRWLGTLLAPESG